jgi:hypothetical protein
MKMETEWNYHKSAAGTAKKFWEEIESTLMKNPGDISTVINHFVFYYFFNLWLQNSLPPVDITKQRPKYFTPTARTVKVLEAQHETQKI